MDFKLLKEIRDYDFKDTERLITAKIKAFDREVDIETEFSIVYSAYMIENREDKGFYKSLNLPKKLNELLDSIIPKYWDLILSLNMCFKKEILLAYILFRKLGFERRSNFSKINMLAEKLLNISEQESVLDMCANRNGFMVDSYLKESEAEYCAMKNRVQDDDIIGGIRASVLEPQWDFKLDNIFYENSKVKFDKIYSFNAIIPVSGIFYEYMEENPRFKRSPRIPMEIKDHIITKMGLNGRRLAIESRDWVVAYTMLENLKEDGKAVSIAMKDSVISTKSKEFIEYFIEKGYIESVILMPDNLERMLSGKSIIFVLSKNNKKVNMIDASNIVVEDETDIDKIVSLVNTESDESAIVSIDLIRKFDYNINPIRYMNYMPTLENGKQLKDLVVSITRGTQAKAAELDALKCDEKTKYRYISISNIEDGYLEVEGNYLIEVPKKKGKYSINNNSIILTRSGGSSFKSALVQGFEDEEVIATGNLYIMEVDEDKIDPRYLQAFLVSDIGKASIESASTGSIMSSLSVSELKNIVVPICDKKKQIAIGKAFIKSIEDMKELKKEYLRKKDESQVIFMKNYKF